MEEKDIVTTGVEGQELAEPENSATLTAPADSVKTEKNAYFANQRRKQQLEQMRADNQRLKRQIEAAGLSPDNLAETAPELAHSGEHSPQAESQAEYTPQADSQLSAMENSIARYHHRQVEFTMADDLRQIQAIDPSVACIQDLPPAFLALRFNSVAPLTASQAFLAVKAMEQQSRQPKPASAGSINGSGSGESEFYTSAQLDALTPKMLDDSKIMEKALRSMARLTKERG